jgi:hypothetical protein
MNCNIIVVFIVNVCVFIKAEDGIFSKGSFKKMIFPSGSCFPNISKEISNVWNKIECGSRCLADPTNCSTFFFEDNQKTCRLADLGFGCNNKESNINYYGYIKLGKASC